MGEAVGTPGGQAFEAVDELIVPVGSGNDTEGQGGGVVGGAGGSTGAKRCEVGTQSLDGNEGDGACHMVWGWRTRWSRRNLAKGLGHGESHRCQKGNWPFVEGDNEWGASEL